MHKSTHPIQQQSSNETLPFVSVIVPTLHREEILCNTLSFLFTQNYPNYEVIVIDQSTKHDQSTEDFLKINAKKIRYVHSSIAGTSKAKNTGAELAKGSILFFCDDDIIPYDDDLLRYHVERYQDQTIGGVGGRVIVKDASMSTNRKHIAHVSKAGVFYDNFSLKEPGEIDTVHGCNMSFRKELFDKVHGFDTSFVGNAFREESDLSFRIRHLGYRLLFEPKAVVFHIRAKTGGTRNYQSRMDWYKDFFHNEVLFFLKQMPKLYFPLFLLAKSRPIFACMFWYGRGTLQAMLTPWKGMMAGWKTYRIGRKSGKY